MHRSSSACRLLPLLCVTAVFVYGAPAGTPFPPIAPAINALGLDLYHEQVKTAANQSVLLSPYSIAAALAMTYAGADGETKVEMQRVLHFPDDPAVVSDGFHALAEQLAKLVRDSEHRVARLKENGGSATPLQLNVANRLFVQRGYALRPAFVDGLRDQFDSGLEQIDFRHRPEAARKAVNGWVAKQTHDRIRDLLPEGQPDPDCRLSLVNALYLKAAWADEFDESGTRDEPFHVSRAQEHPVPTMQARRHFGYAKERGYSVVTIPYQTGGLQCVLLVPDAIDGLAALERKLTAKDLMSCTGLDQREVILHLPKFKLEPDTMPLKNALLALGLKTAFDQPQGSANFARMAPRKPDDYLAIGAVFHKTWLTLDERGTEAAAATIIEMVTLGMAMPREQTPPVEVRADRPFLFAIQHVDSGACLFLGRVTDPQ